MDKLRKIVISLINSKREGDYWDFKLTHHSNNAELLHDILCLANNPRIEGDRYLIYGVKDATFEIVGVGLENKKNQSDIIAFLQKLPFPGGVRPEVSLHELDIDGKIVDVLVIKDRPYKPYYLEKLYPHGSKKVRQGIVYTRVIDSNTPIDSIAATIDIESMWRERFGLSQTPLQRMLNYMAEWDQWEEVEEDHWYYRPAPEFTIAKDKSYESHAVFGGEQWVRAATNPESFVHRFILRYHQTPLTYQMCLKYDEARFLSPAPSSDYFINSINGGYFFYFCADDIDFKILSFFQEKSTQDFLENGLRDRLGILMPVVIFESQSEKDEFKSAIVNGWGEVVPEKEKFIGRKSNLIRDYDVNILAYGYGVISLLKRWRLER